jgi:hypothetical protein
MSNMQRPSDESMFSILDTAEQYIYGKVKATVRESVTEKLLEEFNGIIQEAINSAFSEIIFKIAAERDVFSRAEDVRVLVEWVKCREDKKKYRIRNVVEEVA